MPKARRSVRRARTNGASTQALAPDVLVGPILALERPILLVVAEVARRIERIDDRLRQEPLRKRADLDLERALLAEHRLDATEPRTPEQAREPPVEPLERVLGERDLIGFDGFARLGGRRVEVRGARLVLDQQ